MGENLLVRVKLGHPPNFNFLGKPLLGEKYVQGGKKEERIMPSLVATTSALALRSHQFVNFGCLTAFFKNFLHNKVLLASSVSRLNKLRAALFDVLVCVQELGK